MSIIAKSMFYSQNCQKIRVVLVSFVILLAVLGCARESAEEQSKRESKKAASNSQLPQRRLIGRVQSRPGQGNFVLVETYSSLALEAGTQLFAVNLEGKSTRLVVSGEKMSVFLVADLPDGAVAVGDAVYQDLAIKQPSSQPADSTSADMIPAQAQSSVSKSSSATDHSSNVRP